MAPWPYQRNIRDSEELATTLLGHDFESMIYSRYSNGVINISLLKDTVEQVGFDIGL